MWMLELCIISGTGYVYVYICKETGTDVISKAAFVLIFDISE